MDKRHVKRFIQITALLIALTVGIAALHRRVSAVFDETKAMRFGAYRASHTIDDSTLFIGTYLIHKDSLNDELYEQAKNSAADAGQDNVFYKSELAGGTWFDITDAGSLTDITKSGTPADEAGMANLFVQYSVGKDGILIDVVTNEEKNPFNLVDPYDLSKLPELEALRLQYTYDTEVTTVSQEQFIKNRNAKDSDTVRSAVYYYQLLSTFFSLDLRDDETRKLDRQLDNLYACYKTLKAGENDAEADLVYKLMGKVDSARRAIVLEKLSQIDESALGEVYNLGNGTYYTAKGNFKDAKSENVNDPQKSPEWLIQLRNSVSHDFYSTSLGQRLLENVMKNAGISNGNWWIPVVPDLATEKKDEEEVPEVKNAFTPDSSILEGVTDSIESCQESYNTHSTNRLQDSTSVLGHAEYEYSNQVIEGASAAGLSGDTMNLKYISDIKEGIVTDAAGELALITATLLPRAESGYQSAANSGVSEAYNAAVSNGRGDTAIQNALNDEFDELEAKRSELQYLIDEKKKRADAETMLAEIYNKITIADGWKSGIVNDAFKSKAGLSIDNYVGWLKDEARSIKQSDESLASELDALKDQKDDLMTKKQVALDDNDLALADEYEAKIGALDETIAKAEEKLASDRANASSAGAAAAALVDMGDSMDALADRLLDKAKQRVADGDYDGLANSVDALAGVGDAEALKELQDMLEGTDAPASLKADLKVAVKNTENSSDALVSGQTNKKDGQGTGDGTSGQGAGGTGTGDGAGGAGTGDGAGGAGTGDGAGGAGTGDGAGGAGAGDGAGGAGGAGAGDGAGGAGAGTGAGGAGTGTGAGGAGTGTGAGGAGTDGAGKKSSGSALSEEALRSMVEQQLGATDDMSDEALAAAAAGLAKFSEGGNESAKKLSKEFAELASAKDNPYIFEKFKDDTSKAYVSVEAIARVTEYRYLYNDSKRKATLSAGSKIWEFVVGSKEAKHGGENVDLSSAAVFQYSVMIHTKDAQEFFKCSAQNIPNTDSAICVTETVGGMADELVKLFNT